MTAVSGDLRRAGLFSVLLMCLAAFVFSACQGETADLPSLWRAIRAKDDAALARLLARRPDLSVLTEDGHTCLGLAAGEGYGGGVALLIAAGAPVDLKDRAGNTALERAVAARSIGAVSLLLEAGASIRDEDRARASAERDVDLALMALLGDDGPDATDRAAAHTTAVRVTLSAAERAQLKREIAAEILAALQTAADPSAKIERLRDLVNEEKNTR